MKPLLVTMVIIFLITFLGAPKMGAGWFWDAGNGISFATFGEDGGPPRHCIECHRGDDLP
jgi:hypothetical protein